MNQRNIFLLGMVVSLVIFGFFIPLLPNFNFEFKLNASKAEWLTSIATSLAVFLAVFGERIREWIFPSDLRIVGDSCLVQTDKNGKSIGYTRLLFENYGTIAKEVTCYITDIFDGDKPRENLLPVPLRWTHDGSMSRDILKNQRWYLDLCALNDPETNTGNPKFLLAAGGGIPSYEKVKHGATKVKLVINQSSGRKLSFWIKLQWIRGEDQFVRIINTNHF